MLQKAFEGTEQEFERYRKKRQISAKKRFIVVYEDEELTLEQEKKKAVLVNLFQETEASYQRGEAVPFTPELLDSLRVKAKNRLIASKK